MFFHDNCVADSQIAGISTLSAKTVNALPITFVLMYTVFTKGRTPVEVKSPEYIQLPSNEPVVFQEVEQEIKMMEWQLQYVANYITVCEMLSETPTPYIRKMETDCNNRLTYLKKIKASKLS